MVLGVERARVCRECGRDPDKMPAGFRVRPRGSKSRPGTPAEWAAKVRPVAHGLCPRDYQRRRRGTSPNQKRTGVVKAKTVRLTPAENVLVEEARFKSGLSESSWAARAMVSAAKTELGEEPGK